MKKRKKIIKPIVEKVFEAEQKKVKEIKEINVIIILKKRIQMIKIYRCQKETIKQE